MLNEEMLTCGELVKLGFHSHVVEEIVWTDSEAEDISS